MKNYKCLLPLLALFALTSCTYMPSDPIIPGSSEPESSEPESSEPESSEPESSEPESSEPESSEPEAPKENEYFDGYYKLNQPTMVYEDFTIAAPHTGEANMFVVMIQFDPGTQDTRYRANAFNQSELSDVRNYFFGTEYSSDTWFPLKNYFETVSKGAITVGGQLTDIYEVPDDYSVKAICNSDDPYTLLHTQMVYALEYAKNSINSKNPNFNWSKYDRNNDGYFDNLHFVTNLSYSATQQGAEQPFWPHKWELTMTTDSLGLKGMVYETTSIGHLEDARTIIHEQSHVFGVEDYYDYSYTGADYLGYADMQSLNCFDWNSFSKFAVGWANPYVVDGTKKSTTITIESAALTNQCIVVPANHDTFNGSAFDEYFLIELFTKDGVNKYDWNDYYIGDFDFAKSYGIRIYHVDGRLIDNRGTDLTDWNAVNNALNKGRYISHGCDNSYYDGDYVNFPLWQDYKLLTIIQAGGVNTFGQTDGEGNYDYLSSDDMFYQGDTFTFNDAKAFLSVTNKSVTTMDNGETFPYTISFEEVNQNYAKITFTK